MALDFLFKEKEEKYLKTIEEKNFIIESKDKKIEELEIELEKANNRFGSKQLEIFERNLKNSIEETKKYKAILSSYGIKIDKKNYKYRIEIIKFYSEKKYAEIVAKLNENNLFFIDQLDNLHMYEFLKDIKNLEEATKKYNNFKNGKCSWDIITALNKGEKLTKIYSKSKKLLNVFSDMNFEFADDITNFDFTILNTFGFKKSQIDEFYQKIQEYFNNCRIVEEVR